MGLNLKGLLVGALLVGLFLYAMISFGYNLGVDNNANKTILDDPIMSDSFSELEDQLQSTQGVVEGQDTGFANDIPTIGSDSFLFSSIISVARALKGTAVGIYNLTFGLIARRLGLGQGAGLVVLGTMVSIVTITFIFLMWRFFKTGE